jgi:hypothetical protein
VLLAISLMIAWYMLAWRQVFEDTVHGFVVVEINLA